MIDLNAFRVWSRAPILDVATPVSGTINEGVLLHTESGDYFLRRYRRPDRPHICREHALIAYASVQGLPALPPLPLSAGETILARSDGYYALFPRAPGCQVRREALGDAEIAAMGTCLARLHHGLRAYSPDRVARRAFTVDRAATLQGIGRLEAVIGAKAYRDDFDDDVLTQLAGRRSWLNGWPGDGHDEWDAFGSLDCQVIHGDYQDTNLFFAQGKVSAVIDWDQAYVAPPAWEVARALHLVFDFAPDLCRVFLDAYRAELPLLPADLDRAATAYCRMRAHDLWLYQAVYLEGNVRVRRFIRPGPFVPLIDQWYALRAIL